MSSNKLFITVFAVLVIVLLTGCDYSVADGDLHGRWFASGGQSFEFNNGRFTRTMPNGEVRTGTYETSGNYLTLHRRGFTPETLLFNIAFPVLTVDGIDFFHDSFTAPDKDMEGIWFGYISLHSNWWPSNLMFGPAEPRRGAPMILEGTYQMGTMKGIYTVSRRNRPNDVAAMTMNVTHVSGARLWWFIRYQLPPDLRELFDWELLVVPGHTDGWWFTLDEARGFFLDALGRVSGRPNYLADETRLKNIMLSHFRGLDETDNYDFTMETAASVVYDLFGDKVADPGDFILTLRYGVQIVTFVREAGGSGFGSGFGEFWNTTIEDDFDPDWPDRELGIIGKWALPGPEIKE